MRKLFLISLLFIIGYGIILCNGCCAKGDAACYKAWYGLEPNPNDPNRFTDPWERFLNPEVRPIDDPDQPIWDWLFGIKTEKNSKKD